MSMRLQLQHFFQKIHPPIRSLRWSSHPATSLLTLSLDHQPQVSYLHTNSKLNLNDPLRNSTVFKKPDALSFHTYSLLPDFSNSSGILYSSLFQKRFTLSLKKHLNYEPYVHNFLYSSRLFSDVSAGSGKGHLSQPKQKSQKSSIKEFNFKGKITEHDLSVKMNKIKALLEKGKVVRVFLRTPSSMNPMPVTKFHQTLTDTVSNLGILQKDFSNEKVTRFTLTPVVKKKIDSLEENEA